MTPFFPGLPQMTDARFIDAGGNVATMLDIRHVEIDVLGNVEWFVIAKCNTEGKIFTMTLDKWNETYTAIDSKAFKENIAKKLSADTKA